MTKFLDKITDFVSRFISRDKAEALVRFACFCCVGVINTLVDTAIYSLLFYVVFRLDPASPNPVLNAIAFVAGYGCGVVCSFTLNKIFTFRDNGKVSRQWLPFIIVNLVALGVGEGGLYLLGLIPVTGVLAKIITVPFTLIINFIGSRLFVFKGENGNKNAEE